MTSLVSSHLTPKELYMYVFCFSTKTGEAGCTGSGDDLLHSDGMFRMDGKSENDLVLNVVS